jgi:hypothetical protein
MVSAGSISLLPTGYVPPAGADTVFTQIHSFDLSNGAGIDVTAGSLAPGQPASVGEVISNAMGANIGNPAFDFPAKSFFDIFVDVTLPGLGTPLINSTPLIVDNNAITTFPPVVIYTHGNSSAVPLMFTPGNALGQPAGEVFGVITLAGHGAGYSAAGGNTDENTGLPANATTFESTYSQALNNPSDLMPLPQAYASWSTYVPSVPEPSSVSLLAVGIVGLGFATLRKKYRRA